MPADLRSQADLLLQEANRARAIAGNLLDFARQRPSERVEESLRPLVDGVLELASYLLRRARATVEVDIPADLPLLVIDRSAFRHALLNLTLNAAGAIRSSGRPGTIRIGASVIDDGRSVRIAISDDGPGVPDAIADRLLGATEAPDDEAAGGLFASSAIVAAHGGTIRHEPRPGGGGTFVIELPHDASVRPAIPRPARDEAAVGAEPANSGEAPAPDRAGRILVLDDEPSIRDFLGRVLARSGYEPVLAATGDTALDAIRADPPDAILCDHRMAGMSGTEFHAAVVAIAPALGRRFAFMSGDVLNGELQAFATEKGVQLMAKPFDIASVGETVRRLLRDAPA